MKREIYTEEHDIFRDAFRKFLEKEVVPHQEEWIEAGIVPREIWKKTGEQGFIQLMQKLQQERLVSAIGAVASMWTVLDWTKQYCQERSAIGLGF